MGHHGCAWLPGTLCPTTHTQLNYHPQPGSSTGLGHCFSLERGAGGCHQLSLSCHSLTRWHGCKPGHTGATTLRLTLQGEQKAFAFPARRCPEGEGPCAKPGLQLSPWCFGTRFPPPFSTRYLRYQVLVDPLQLGALPPILGNDCLLVELMGEVPVLIVIHGAAERKGELAR